MKKEKTAGRKSRRKLWLLIAAALFLIVLIGTESSLLTLRGAERTVDAYREMFPNAEITVLNDGSVELKPGSGTEAKSTGFIFYVGAQILPEAYIPLLARLTEAGYFCSIPKLPFQMANLKPDAAAAVMEAHPEMENWYVGGHSMGGLTVAGFAADNADKVKGIVLLAAYPMRDLSAFKLPVLSIYGDRDGVLNKKRYEAFLAEAPAELEEHILPGGNHAQFGDYGLQPHDNEAAISDEEQQAATAELLLDWLQRHENV